MALPLFRSDRPTMWRARSARSGSRSCRNLGAFNLALMPVTDALAAILAGSEPLGEEIVPLDAAWHRILARDVAARRTQPPQAMSAMDGYAVRATDAADLKARLKVIGEVAAGRPFGRTVGAGEAARLFTGGGIPEGADAVIIQEDTTSGGDTLTTT